MKILLVCGQMESGGAETHILCLAKGLCERGNEVWVLSSGGKITRQLRKYTPHILTLPLESKNPAALLYCLRALRILIKAQKFHVLHAHTRPAALLASLALHGSGTRFVTTIHSRFDMSGMRGALSRWGDKTIAVSYDLKAYLCTHSKRVAGENVTVIPNGIDTQKFCPARGRTPARRILFLSRLDGDCSDAAYALCRLAERLERRFCGVEIVIGGGGSEYARIYRLAERINRRLGKRTIKVVGQVFDVPRLMRDCDIFVGVSRAAIEAMSCGLCVVLAGNEGFGGVPTRESIENSANGNFCCRDEGKLSDNALYRSLFRLLASEASARADMGKFLRNYVLEHCSYNTMAKLCEDVYKSIKIYPEVDGREVLLCGYYGYGNLGDDMLLRSAIQRARREFAGARICALTAGGARERKYFGVRCARRKSPLSLLCGIWRSEAVIFGGGTLLQTSTSRRSLLYYIFIMRIAEAMGKRVLLWGNGIGEIRGRHTARALAAALGDCEYIGLRDRGSADIVRGLLHAHGGICLEHDLAFGKQRLDMGGARYALSRMGIKEGQKYAVVALRHDEARECIGEAIRYIRRLTAEGIFPIFVAMYPAKDLAISQRLAFRLGGALAYPLDAPTLAAIIQGAVTVISMRYHALVLASSLNTPYVAIGTQKKIREFELSVTDNE